MKSFLTNFNISKRISFVIGVPLIGLLILSSVLVGRNYNEYNNAKFLNEVVTTINELAELTHRLQVERGRSAGFVGGASRAIPDSLKEARADVDVELKKFHDVIVSLRGVLDQEILDELESIEADFANLDETRNLIASKDMSIGNVLGYYTKIINHIFEVGFHASELAGNAKIALEIIAMLELGEAKEYAGRERGAINGALSAGKISKEQKIKFHQSVAVQELMLANFLANEPKVHRAEYEQYLRNTQSKELEQYRSAISGAELDLSGLGISPKRWFEETTSRIIKLRDLEKKVASDIFKDTNGIRVAALYGMLFSSILGLTVTIASLLIGFLVAKSITSPLSKLVDSMEKISDGDLDLSIEGQNRGDEIGSMSRSLAVFHQKISEKGRIEEDARIARERATSAKEADAAKRKLASEQTRFAVDKIGAALNRLSQGDLTGQIKDEFSGDLDELRLNFNDSISRLAQTLSEVGGSIHTISNSSGELKSATAELSRRTEDQASSLQHVASSIETINQAAQNSAKDASEAKDMATAIRKSTLETQQVVSSAIESMARIEKASDEIASIITVMDEISFQTNLLALNAGVEAARAGESGKGFAVVAQEVRELAQRSASAANEIKQLIESSGSEVKGGVKQVSSTESALGTVGEQVAEVARFIESIASATEQQSQSLGTCSQSIAKLDRSTQQNAAMAEESTAVVQDLAGDAVKLSRIVDNFVIDSTHRGNQEAA